MSDPQTTPEMESLVGKIIGKDITEEEIVDMFPEKEVKILNQRNKKMLMTIIVFRDFSCQGSIIVLLI